jgi:hypothetical protein
LRTNRAGIALRFRREHKFHPEVILISEQNVEFVKGFLTAGAGADKQALLAAASTAVTMACVSLSSGGSTNGTNTASRPNDSSITATTCS